MELLVILPDVTGSGKSKMAASKPGLTISRLVVHLCNGARVKTVQLILCRLAVQLFNGACANTVGPNRKSEIQYGGCQTGSTRISAPRGDRNEIPTATPTFSESSFSMEPLSTLWDVTGSQKSKMAAATGQVSAAESRKRGRCQSCPRNKDQKVEHRCSKCNCYVCGQHGLKEESYACMKCPLLDM